MSARRTKGPTLDSGKPAGTRGWFQNFPQDNDPDYVHFMDDFMGVIIDASDWTVLKDSSASVALVADKINGYVTLTSQATTDNDGASIQGNEIFQPLAGRNIWFETVIQGESVADQDICVGLTINFATNPEAMLTAADRIVFQVLDGDASVKCITEFSGAETLTDSNVDMVDDTDITLGFLIKGTSSIEFYVNRNLVQTHTSDIVTDQLLAAAAMSLSGSTTGTRTLHIDYINVIQTR